MAYSVCVFIVFLLSLAIALPAGADTSEQQAPASAADQPQITPLDPPVQGFFTKEVVYQGIPIMAPAVVSDDALYAAYQRVSMELAHLPQVTANIAAAGGQVQIIGKDQVTSDLPEFRNLKGKPLAEYNGLTIDQRTRGMGGLHTSCGEENLLQLPNDRYHGRDILVHEFGHCIRNVGMQQSVRDMFNAQYKASLAKGLWVGSYAGSNPDEFFAELTMWYFGTHGDLNMTGPKPDNGPQGLKKYDPDAYKLFDDFYSGRIPITPVTYHRRHRYGQGSGQSSSTNSTNGSSSSTSGTSSSTTPSGATSSQGASSTPAPTAR